MKKRIENNGQKPGFVERLGAKIGHKIAAIRAVIGAANGLGKVAEAADQWSSTLTTAIPGAIHTDVIKTAYQMVSGLENKVDGAREMEITQKAKEAGGKLAAQYKELDLKPEVVEGALDAMTTKPAAALQQLRNGRAKPASP